MLVFCDNLTLTMISFRVELTLTLLFFTKTLIGVKCSEEVQKCKDLVQKIGFDEFSNGVYNYCFAHQFSKNEYTDRNFPHYLTEYGGFINRKEKKIISIFFIEIMLESVDAKYTPWTPRDYCQSLDEHDRDQIVLEVLKNGDCIFHKNDFVNSTDKKYILSPMDFCEQTCDMEPTYLGYMKPTYLVQVPFLTVWLANYSCARDIKKNKIYGDDPYENLITSYKNQYEPQEEKDEIYINKIEGSGRKKKSNKIKDLGGKTKSNKIKLSGYEKKYYKKHRESFPELNIILCAKQIKKNGYFGDNKYANLVKSHIFDLLVKRETDKKAKPVYDKLWNSVKEMSGGGAWLKLDDLSGIQKKYYYYHQHELTKLDENVEWYSVEAVCKRLMNRRDIVSIIKGQNIGIYDEDYGDHTVQTVDLADAADSGAAFAGAAVAA